MRKEVLGLQSDPRSPEHGQYGFLQDLLRQVAYDTLSEEGTPDEAPAGRRAPERRYDRGGGRRGGRLAPPARRIGSSPMQPTAQLMTRAQACARPRRRACGLARCLDGSAALLRAGRGPGADGPTQASALFRAGEMAMLEGRRRGGRDHCSSGRSAIRIGRRHACGRAGPELARLLGTDRRKARGRQSSGWSARYEVVSGDAPDGDLAMLALQARPGALLRRRTGAGAGVGRAEPRRRRGAAAAGDARARLVGQGRR